MASLLIIGRDEGLTASRALVMERQHNQTRYAFSVQDAIAEVKAVHFDLVLVCHTMTAEETAALTIAVRKLAPKTKIIKLLKYISFDEPRLKEHDASSICDSMARFDILWATMNNDADDAERTQGY
jgi:DNA-binding NtrC family response regulator